LSLAQRRQAHVENAIASGWVAHELKDLKATPLERKETIQEYVVQLRQRYPVKMSRD
jgi:hypothetical protein